MRFAYSRGQYPPALVVNVVISNLERTFEISLEAKVDTGAAMSAVPRTIIPALRPEIAGTVRARGAFDRQSEERPVYYLRVTLPWQRSVSRATKMVVTEESCALIGRDLLNQFTLTADGPGEIFDIE